MLDLRYYSGADTPKYDAIGNLLNIYDYKLGSPQTQTFTYDALNRLISGAATGGTNGLYDEGYSYDPATGNLASKTGMGNYSYNVTHKHAVASTSSGWSYQYDANGNLTRRDPPGSDYYDFVYDAENRITQAKKNGTVIASFVYDGDGKRVKATVNGVTTSFVGTYFEWTNGQMTKYYYAAGQRIAMRDNGTLYYLFGDHLGSTSVSYRASDGQTTRQLYKPWGEPRYASGSLPTDYTYTGQYSYADDIATPTVTEGFGLLFYQARFYDPLLARFLSADSVVPGAYNPLAFDRYAYVFNSPLNYVDPSGHLTCGSNSHIAEDDCDPIGAPPDFDPGKYKDSYERGIKFVIWLRFHEGWWSKYMKDSATVWKFQVALAYSWETNGVLNKQFLKNMGKAFDNKLGHFTAQFGLAGYYIFLGSMQTVRTYTGKNITEPAKLKQAFAYTEEVWDGKWSMGPDDPYDFANPMPGKHKPEFLEKLNLCATTYGQNCTITKWNKMNTGFDLLNILVSPKKNGDGYSIALIVSYQQNQNIWISK